VPCALGGGVAVNFGEQPETAFDVAVEAATDENDSTFQRDP